MGTTASQTETDLLEISRATKLSLATAKKRGMMFTCYLLEMALLNVDEDIEYLRLAQSGSRGAAGTMKGGTPGRRLQKSSDA